MTTKSTDSASRLTAKEYACIHTKVPNSANEWLDELIQAARDLDAEQFKAKLTEHAQQVEQVPVKVNLEGYAPYDQAAGRIERPEKEPTKTPKPVSKKRKDEIVKDLNPDGKWD